MTIEAKIRNTLLPFGCPVENGVFQGKDERYFVFNFSTAGNFYADDAPSFDRYIVQVHYFAPIDDNITSLRKRVKKALFRAGFTWPECINADDSEGRHAVFECEIAEEIDPDGEV